MVTVNTFVALAVAMMFAVVMHVHAGEVFIDLQSAAIASDARDPGREYLLPSRGFTLDPTRTLSETVVGMGIATPLGYTILATVDVSRTMPLLYRAHYLRTLIPSAKFKFFSMTGKGQYDNYLNINAREVKIESIRLVASADRMPELQLVFAPRYLEFEQLLPGYSKVVFKEPLAVAGSTANSKTSVYLQQLISSKLVNGTMDDSQ